MVITCCGPSCGLWLCVGAFNRGCAKKNQKTTYFLVGIIAMRLRESSNFCYSTFYLKLKLQATKVTSIYTLDKSIIELMILRMLQYHYAL
jgi:hypothetical protein